MLKSMLIATVLCTVVTAADAAEFQQLTVPMMPLRVAPMPDPVMQAQAFQAQMRAQQAEMENQRLQMQMRQYQMQAAGAAIGNSLDHIAHACDPDVVRQPGVHLLARLGLCDQHRAEAVAQERVAAQPRAVPPMHNGPMSVYDRPYPYYKGH